MRYLALSVAAATATLLAPTAAQAAVGLGACSITDISPTAIDCEGLFSGNVFSGNPADVTAQTSALAALGYSWSGGSTTLGGTGNAGNPFFIPGKKDVANAFSGITYVGIFFDSKTKDDPFTGSAFYKFDAGAGLPSFFETIGSSSKAVLYATGIGAVPEPSTWVMMILGFGAVGFAMRNQRKRVRTTVTFA